MRINQRKTRIGRWVLLLPLLVTGCVVASQPDPAESSETQGLSTAPATTAAQPVRLDTTVMWVPGVGYVPVRPQSLNGAPGPNNAGDPSATGDGTGNDPHPSPWHGDLTGSATGADDTEGCDPHPSPWNPRGNVTRSVQ